jgi:hypothetical protein
MNSKVDGTPGTRVIKAATSGARSCALVLCAVALIIAPGCHKSNPGAAQVPVNVNGVMIDLPKLQKAFPPTGDREALDCVRGLTLTLRYGDYVGSLAQMDKLVNLPSLTDEQKQVANQVLEQVKQLAAKSQPAAGH